MVYGLKPSRDGCICPNGCNVKLIILQSAKLVDVDIKELGISTPEMVIPKKKMSKRDAEKRVARIESAITEEVIKDVKRNKKLLKDETFLIRVIYDSMNKGNDMSGITTNEIVKHIEEKVK
jgi:hypothetical protein